MTAPSVVDSRVLQASLTAASPHKLVLLPSSQASGPATVRGAASIEVGSGKQLHLLRTDILALHNGYRRVHQAPALTSSASVVSGAQSWANNLAATCTFKHSGASGKGQKAAACMAPPGCRAFYHTLTLLEHMQISVHLPLPA
ncbi:SCP domain-containing protein [Haematococcus lacustris]|uniref:SCP domain-containing protein n=1 Tax=Haematococcus lacustris TaxID=44745 RepID=A0A6A0AAG1_HAELA|nr:SCP domain-containing protein [Haematococcus lacustris]